jgi:hypothetical protein
MMVHWMWLGYRALAISLRVLALSRAGGQALTTPS